MSRPELIGSASNFYNDTEARKYDSSSRMVGIQAEITKRAVELLQLEEGRPSLILDVGCGSGLSGKVLEDMGHYWVGCDSKSFVFFISCYASDSSSSCYYYWFCTYIHR